MAGDQQAGGCFAHWRTTFTCPPVISHFTILDCRTSQRGIELSSGRCGGSFGVSSRRRSRTCLLNIKTARRGRNYLAEAKSADGRRQSPEAQGRFSRDSASDRDRRASGRPRSSLGPGMKALATTHRFAEPLGLAGQPRNVSGARSAPITAISGVTRLERAMRFGIEAGRRTRSFPAFGPPRSAICRKPRQRASRRPPPVCP